MTELRFSGRVALVTGGGRGMGRAHALALAERGASVVVADAGVDLFGSGSDPGPAGEVVDAVRAAGGEAVAYGADLSTEAGARGAVRAAVAAFGRLDVVVHNAGFTLGGRPFEDESVDRLDRLLAVNTRAAYALVQEAWPHMQRQQHGRVVLASSTAVYGMATSVPYATAKASYVGLVRSLAAAGRPDGITVNAVAPSAATRMSENLAPSPFRDWFLRTMRPEQVSPVVVALVHDDCPVSGELFVVGGGRVARTVLGETAGYVNPDLAPEDVRDHLDRIVADEDLSFPADTAASLRLTAAALGDDLDALEGAGGLAASPTPAAAAAAAPIDPDPISIGPISTGPRSM